MIIKSPSPAVIIVIISKLKLHQLVKVRFSVAKTLVKIAELDIYSARCFPLFLLFIPQKLCCLLQTHIILASMNEPKSPPLLFRMVRAFGQFCFWLYYPHTRVRPFSLFPICWGSFSSDLESFFVLQVINQQYIPKDPCIFVANHSNALVDAVVMYTQVPSDRITHALAKSPLFDIPFIGMFSESTTFSHLRIICCGCRLGVSHLASNPSAEAAGLCSRRETRSHCNVRKSFGGAL